MKKKKAYVSFEPEYFEPGTLVVLDRKIFDDLSSGSPGLGLIVGFEPERVPDATYGSQYCHSVVVDGKMYKALRSTFIRAVEEQ